MKRWLMTVAVFLLMVSGCAQPESADKSTIELEFWTMSLQPFEAMLRDMIAEYEANHPGIKIKWLDVPGSVIQKRALTAMLGPRVPDVINLNPDFSAVLATRQALLDMNTALAPAQKQMYLPAAWQASTLVTPKGPITFGLPWYITSKVTFYNRALLDEAGVDTPPKTMADLLSLAQKTKARTRAYAVMPNIAVSGNFLKELYRAGVPLYDEKGQARFATPQAEQFLSQWVQLYQQGWMPAETLIEGPEGAVDRYQSGSLSLLMAGANFGKRIQENAPTVFAHTDVAPQFPAQGSRADFSTMVLVVPRQSKHPNEAIAFARYITNAQNQMRFIHTAQVPILPSVSSALKDPYFQQPNSPNLLTRSISLSARQLLQSEGAYQIRPRQQDINAVMDFQVQRAMLGKTTAKQALLDAQTTINQILEDVQ